MKISSILYGLALLSLPLGPALKLMFGSEEMVWIDPTLIFAALAFVALIPIWNSSDSIELAGPTLATVVLTLLCIASALSGYLIRPSTKPYDALREPIRFFLTMLWFLTSCWFLRFRRKFVFRCAAAAVLLALLSGIYVDLAAAGFIPAPQQVTEYAQIYILRQLIYVGGQLIPRMGGFFIEAPPFGLFMLSMAAFSYLAYRADIRQAWIRSGLILSLIGLFASLADQALLGFFIAIPTVILSIKSRRRWVKPILVITFGALLAILGLESLTAKLMSEAQTTSTTHIYQDSVGERSFHVEYGLSLFLDKPVASFLGIGPGRYGEYVAETGLFPDTVTMQTTEPELLIEWGVLGLGVWIVVIALTARTAWRLHGLMGVGLLVGICLADSFQSNWKAEAAFLAIAALCSPSLADKDEEPTGADVLPHRVEAAAG